MILSNLQFVALQLICSSFHLLSVFCLLFCNSLHRSITSTLPNVNLQMPKVPNLTVSSVNLPQMPSFSPPNWMTSNDDTECVSALCILRHTYMSLAWMWHLIGMAQSSRVTCNNYISKTYLFAFFIHFVFVICFGQWGNMSIVYHW